MPHLIGRKIKNGYLLTRGISTFLTLAFSLLYSKLLGIEKRSLITLMLVIIVIVMVILTSGVGLAFRKYIASNSNHFSLSAYLYLNIILSFLVSTCAVGILLLYSNSRVAIPDTLIYLAAIYAFLGALDFTLHQGLIAYGMFKVASILDLLTVFIQISVFFLLTLSNQVSIAVSLFTSLIISYVTSVVSSVLTLIVHSNASIIPSWKDIRFLLKASTPFHIVGIANGFADRIDRIVIAWFLPLSILGKFAVGTSVLTFLRFIPESFSKFIVSGQSKLNFGKLELVAKSWLVRLALALFASYFFALLSQGLIWLVLGQEWLISFFVVFCFAFQEFLRGYFHLRVSELVANSEEKTVTRLSVALMVVSSILSILGVSLAGLVGIPIGIALSYFALILFSYKLKIDNIK
jgi:O-antigen/teichoic acid export membrane protein